MDKLVEKFLAEDAAKEREKAFAYRRETLEDAGLFEKLYAPENCNDSETYPYWDYDKERRYKKVFAEVTDEEFVQIEKIVKKSPKKLSSIFQCVGQRIMDFAKAFFWIEAIAAVITGIIVGTEAYSGGFFIFLGIALGGICVAYITAIFLYGFGQLVEDIHQLREKAEKE